MSNVPPTAEEIQRQMQRVRTEMREDVRELVKSARAMTVWQRYVEAYPWACLAAAAFAGYMIVPGRTRGHLDPRIVSEMVKDQMAQRQTATVKPSAGGIVSSVLSGVAGVAVNTLLQGGVSILGKQLNRYVEQTLHRMQEPHANGEVHDHA